MIADVTDSAGLKELRGLVAQRKELDAQIDDATDKLLRDGEFVEDVADALGKSREKVRRFRRDHGIPDARDIRRAKGLPERRPAS